MMGKFNELFENERKQGRKPTKERSEAQKEENLSTKKNTHTLIDYRYLQPDSFQRYRKIRKKMYIYSRFSI